MQKKKPCNITVTHIEPTDINEIRTALRNLYDLCNVLFKDHPECFYTQEEIEEQKRSGEYEFI